MKCLWTVIGPPLKVMLFALVAGVLLLGCDGGDASPVCGDGTCEAGETSISCPDDCPEGFCPEGSECTSNEDCEDEYGPLHYCNPHTCICWECLADSDNCRTDEECQDILGDPGASCIPALCACAPSCPEDSPCWGLPPDYACTTTSGVPGTCQDCECVATTCGNDVVDAGEECDGGVEPGTCGEICDTDLYDGAVPCGPDPDCDRGGCEAGFYCSDSCACEPAPTNACGDRYVSHEEGEQCEPFGCSIFTYTDTCPTDIAPDSTCTEVPGGIERCSPNEFCSTSVGEVCDTDTCQCVPGPPPPVPVCGNYTCDTVLGETCATCETDCGPCLPASGGEPDDGDKDESDDSLPGADGTLCGDGICQPGESSEWCGDCPSSEKDEPEPEKEPEKPPAPKKPVCGDGVLEPKLGEECDPPGTICYDSKGAAGDCQPDCTCRGPF